MRNHLRLTFILNVKIMLCSCLYFLYVGQIEALLTYIYTGLWIGEGVDFRKKNHFLFLLFSLRYLLFFRFRWGHRWSKTAPAGWCVVAGNPEIRLTGHKHGLFHVPSRGVTLLPVLNAAASGSSQGIRLLRRLLGKHSSNTRYDPWDSLFFLWSSLLSSSSSILKVLAVGCFEH